VGDQNERVRVPSSATWRVSSPSACRCRSAPCASSAVNSTETLPANDRRQRERTTLRMSIAPRRGALLLATLLTALLRAACGGSSNSRASSSATAADATGTRSSRVRCLREHGVKLPAGASARGSGLPRGSAPPGGVPGAGSGAPPSGSGPGFPGSAVSSKFKSALKACGAKFPGRPGGASGFPAPGD
jgi:hypothetical protein